MIQALTLVKIINCVLNGTDGVEKISICLKQMINLTVGVQV